MDDNKVYPNEVGKFYMESEKVRCLHCRSVFTGWNLSKHKSTERCIAFQESKGEISQQEKEYRQQNTNRTYQRKKECHRECIQEKKYFCSICDVACVSKHGLEKHLDTLKHAYANLNSVD